MLLTSAAARYLKRGSVPKDFGVSAVLGLPEYADLSSVYRALLAIVARHEALHACYIGGHEPKYFVDLDSRSPSGFNRSIDLRAVTKTWSKFDESVDSDVELEIRENLSRLSPDEGRLIAAAFVQTSAGISDILILTVHHLPVDGVSWTVLLRELSAEIAGTGTPTPPQMSCSQWVQQMRILPPRGKQVVDYWKTLWSDPGLPEEMCTEDVVLSGSVAGSATERIMKESPRRYGAAPGDIMLAAFGIAIQQVLGCSPTILAQGHGRYGNLLMPNRVDLTNTVGWLADDFPVRIAALAGDFDPLTVGLASLPDSPEDFTLCSYYCDETAREFCIESAPKLYFNYWGVTPASEGCLSIPPDVAANQMEIGNAGTFQLALQVRTRVDTIVQIEWILYSRLTERVSMLIMKRWTQLISGGYSENSTELR